MSCHHINRFRTFLTRRGAGVETWATAAVTGSLWCVAGCAATVTDATPEGAVAAYAQALERGDARAAYALLSEDQQQELDPDEFDRQIGQYQAETQSRAEALSAKPLDVERRARVVLVNGRELTLVRENDHWRIRTPLALHYDQSTPRAALRSFLWAMRHERWDVVLDLMPEQARGDLTAEQLGANLGQQREELERMLALLSASQDAPIERTGQRATMPYGDRFAVRFVKEGDLWKIEDPE